MPAFVVWIGRHRRPILIAAFAVAMLGLWLGLLLHTMPLRPRTEIRANHSGYADIAGFSDAGHRLVLWFLHSDPSGEAWQGGPVQVWDIPSRRLLHTIGSREDRLCSVALSPDGKYVAVLDRSPCVVLLNNETGKRSVLDWLEMKGAATGRGGGNCSFSPDSRLLACSVYREWLSDSSLVLWDIRREREVFRLKGEAGPPSFSPDSGLLATFRPHAGEADLTITLWDTSTGQTRKSIQAYGPIERPLVFSRDGKLLAFATDVPGSSEYSATLTIHNLEYDRQVAQFDRVSGLTCSGSVLLVHLWQPDQVELTRSLPLEPYLQLLAPIAPTGPLQHDSRFSLNGRFIIQDMPGTDERGNAWTWFTETVLGSLPPEQDPYPELEFRDCRAQELVAKIKCIGSYRLSSDGPCLAMVGDQSIQIWDLPPRRPVFLMLLLSAVPALLFTALVWWRLGR